MTGEPPAEPAESVPRTPLRRSRIGQAWVGLIIGALLLVLLLIFILQNDERVRVSFLTVDGRLSLGVALLLAALAGALVVAVPGTARIIQLRRAARTPRKPRDAQR
jgi:lipopolysaccharide assembly protein A